MGIAVRAAPRSATATCSRCCVERGWECGGENSGHLICLDKHTTGDGIVSALQVLAALVSSGTALGEFTARAHAAAAGAGEREARRASSDLQAAGGASDAGRAAEADARRPRPRAAAALGHRARAAGDGRGRDRAHVQELADPSPPPSEAAAQRASPEGRVDTGQTPFREPAWLRDTSRLNGVDPPMRPASMRKIVRF